MIKILVGTDVNGQSQDFLVELMKIGLEPYIATSQDEFDLLLKSKKPLVIIYDVDSESFSGFDGFKKIIDEMKASGKAHVFLTYSSKSTTEFVRDALKLGVDGFIPKPMDRVTLEKILNTVVVGSDLVAKNAREYIRVKPNAGDACSADIEDLNGKFKFSSSVMDLSLVGVALKVSSGSADGVDTTVSVNLSLSDFGIIKFKPSHVITRGNVVVFNFSNLLPEEYKIICGYLYDNLIKGDGLGAQLLNIVN